MSAQLDNQAISILKENDLGGYTIPTKGLYPYQWNWDSAFVALGFATFNMNRAWEEIELLFEGQWDDGMVPHIIFRKDDPSYFPGPSVWGTTNPKIPTSGHSQPPVAATVVRRLFEQDTSAAGKEKIKSLFPKLLAWHRWYHTYRDPEGHGVIASCTHGNLVVTTCRTGTTQQATSISLILVSTLAKTHPTSTRRCVQRRSTTTAIWQS